MNRSNVILIAAGAVVVVVSGALAFFAQGKFAASAKAEKRIKSDRRKLEEVYQSELFPSDENVEALKAQAERLASLRAVLTNDLVRYNTPAPQVTPPRFVQALNFMTRSLVDKAPIVDGKKCVAPGFAFGFDRYLGPTAAMPEAEDVPRLLQQLYVIANDGIVKALYDAQVSHISAISREVFERGTPAASGGGARTGGRRRGGPVSAAASRHSRSAAPSSDGGNGLFSSQHFRVEVQARQGAAIDFLNRVAGMEKFFCVVTDVTFRKSGEDIILPAARSSSDDEPSAEEAPRRTRHSRGSEATEAKEAPGEGLAVQKVSSLPAELRTMSGPDVDPLLSVVAEIDVYYFGRNPAIAPAGSAPKEE